MTAGYPGVADELDLEEAAPARVSPGRRDAAALWRVFHLGFGAPGRVELFHYDEEALPEECFRVRTLYCGISPGTELTHFTGSNPYLHARWDDRLKLFVEGEGPGATYPVPFSGYMQVGRVAASRSEAAREGELVAMSYG